MDQSTTCVIYRCDEPRQHLRMCVEHYLRATFAEMNAHPVRRCVIDGCTRPCEGGGLCAAHAQRNRAYGSPHGGAGQVVEIDWPGCRVGDCERPARTARGSICKMHQQVYRRAGLPVPQSGEPVWQPVGQYTCTIADCSNKCRYQGLCGKHYQRKRILGDANAAPSRQKGVRHPDAYIQVTVMADDGTTKQVPEHRIVMEAVLGRKLVKKENVHHMNGDRHDNRPENLELWNTAQPCGQRAEDKVTFAVEMLKLYAPHLLA